MGIYATWLSIDDDDHDLTCATWRKVKKAEAEGKSPIAIDGAGRYWVQSGEPCDCEDKPPIIYQGSHVNPDPDDSRGGYVYLCAIPNHCHPSVRYQSTDDGPPVEFLRLSVGEHHTTYRGGHPGDATVVLDRRQVEKMHETMGQWLESRERC